MTSHKGVTGVAWITLADGIVIGCSAVGVATTDSRTGVATLLTDTGFVSGTLSADNTLWLALNVGVAYVLSNASAGGCIVPFKTVSIDATG